MMEVGSPSRKRTAAMEAAAETWEVPERRERLRRRVDAEGNVGSVEDFPTLDEDEFGDDGKAAWEAEQAEHDGGAEEAELDEQDLLEQEKGIERMEEFGVFELVEKSSPELSEHEKLTVRWVKQKRGDTWRCRLVGRECKFSDPRREGLFTVATAHVTGRLLDFYATEFGYSRMVGDACNAYFHTPQNRKVYFPVLAEMRKRIS